MLSYCWIIWYSTTPLLTNQLINWLNDWAILCNKTIVSLSLVFLNIFVWISNAQFWVCIFVFFAAVACGFLQLNFGRLGGFWRVLTCSDASRHTETPAHTRRHEEKRGEEIFLDGWERCHFFFDVLSRFSIIYFGFSIVFSADTW